MPKEENVYFAYNKDRENEGDLVVTCIKSKTQKKLILWLCTEEV